MELAQELGTHAKQLRRAVDNCTTRKAELEKKSAERV